MAEKVVIGTMQDAVEASVGGVIGDVKSLFLNPINDGKVVVVVEGADDKDVYEKVLDENAVCFYPDYDCLNHFIILNALNGPYWNRLLAIKDADFDRLEGVNYTYPNLVLTDAHDIEGMIVDDCLLGLQGEDAARCQGINMAPIYVELEDISYMRWYNHASHACLIFKGVIPNTDFTKYFNTVVAKTKFKRTVTVTLADIVAFKNENVGAPKKQLTNGHDIFERVYVRARESNSRVNFPKRPFFRRLRRAYPKERFVNTGLFGEIKAWETANGRSILAVA